MTVFIWLLRRSRKQVQTNDLPIQVTEDEKKDDEDKDHEDEKDWEEEKDEKKVEDDVEDQDNQEDDDILTEKEEEDKDEMKDEDGDDVQFLRRHVLFMKQQQLRNLETGRLLGVGGFGSVRKVVYEGTEAVVKELLDADALLPLVREARLLVELNGAGGVPRLLAVC